MEYTTKQMKYISSNLTGIKNYFINLKMVFITFSFEANIVCD